MTDRRIFKRLKVMSTLCDTGMPVQKGTLAMNELQQQKLQVCGNKSLGTKNSKTNEESG